MTTTRSHVGMELPAEAVEAAVARINRVHRQQGIAWVRALGAAVVELFFDGDVTLLRLRGRRHRPLRAVARHPALEMSASTLWYALAIYEQLDQLPHHVGRALTVSHHRRLVPVRDHAVKLRLAEQAAEEGWSVRQLEAAVSAQRARETAGSRAGRPPLPGFVKAIRRLPRAMERGLDGLDRRTVACLPQDEVDGMLATVETELKKLQLLQRALESYRE